MEEREQIQSQKPHVIRIGKYKIDKTLFELLAGILFWGLLCQIVGVWFVKDRGFYSLGLWIGVILAAVSGIHMWWGLNKALDFPQDAAVKVMTKYNIFRYVIIVAVLGGIMISGFASPLSAFLALLGLKVAAYLQPFTHKICTKYY